MNFFEHQTRAQRRTGLLIFYFAISVVLVLATVNAAIHFLLSGNPSFRSGIPPGVYLWTTLITAAVILGGTLSGMARMSGGGAAVAAQMGARSIPPHTSDPDEKRLQNVVEEMAIASGIAVPDLFVFAGDEINAFAAGTKPDLAVVAVSEGALKTLSREELQGVVAHEFSHIFNGDMRLNVRLIGILNGIVMIALLGRVLMHARGGKNSLPLLGLGLFVIGYAGLFMSRIIKSAISRQREFLADASAVQFTRNPAGLLSALVKIGRGSSLVDHPNAEEISHLFFAQGFQSVLGRLFATHPPLAERIRAIDPAYRMDVGRNHRGPRASVAAASAFSSGQTAAASVTPAAVTEAIATPTACDVEAASVLRAAIPAAIENRLTSASGAAAVVFGLLLNEPEEVRAAQLQVLKSRGRGTTADEADESRRSLRAAGISLRLPILELAIPALRHFSPEDRLAFLENVNRFVHADKRISSFEFSAEVLLRKNLLAAGKGHGRGNLRDAICLLSFLAHAGARDRPQEAGAAFQKGYAELAGSAKTTILPRDHCGPAAARKSLFRLSLVPPAERKKLVAAFAACVLADGAVGLSEWEILRTICQCLDCPTPILPPDTVLNHNPAPGGNT